MSLVQRRHRQANIHAFVYGAPGVPLSGAAFFSFSFLIGSSRAHAISNPARFYPFMIESQCVAKVTMVRVFVLEREREREREREG